VIDPDSIGHNPTVDLSDRQRVAIESLVASGTQTEAAVAAGVTRQTVNSWVNHHIGFIVELNQRRHEQIRISAQRLQTTISAAIDNIEDRITQGDTTAALQLLKLVGVGHLLPLLSAGPRTPLGVENRLVGAMDSEMFMSTEHRPVAQFTVQDLATDASDIHDGRD
jgi:hypothetical protein